MVTKQQFDCQRKKLIMINKSKDRFDNVIIEINNNYSNITVTINQMK